MITPDSRIRDFPMLERMVYLNTAAEGIPPRAVHDALEAYWEDKLLGMKGREGHFAQFEACREVAARAINLKTDEVSFCSCSAEAYNLLASALDLQTDDEVVISDLDFPSGATPWLRATRPPRTHVWRARNGTLALEDLFPLLNANTRLVQVSLISFYNGYRLAWPSFHSAVRRLAPQALISVDVTQALGRILLDCEDADCIISSTHKWALGLHGGCIVGIPRHRAKRLTTHAGGWYHFENAFDVDRFERIVPRNGASSFSVGMPNFAAIYALNASLRYLESVGVKNIASHADSLVELLLTELVELGLSPMVPSQSVPRSGIIAFRHPLSSAIHARLEEKNIQVMHHAGRIRIAIHGYNTFQDAECFLGAMREILPAL